MANDPNAPQSSVNPSPQEKGAKVEPSGYKGENPATAGPGNTQVDSPTPENRLGHLNPSAPGDAGTTPGSTTEK